MIEEDSLGSYGRRRGLAPRQPRLLGANLFRSVLIRERKRAERSGGAVVLVLVAESDAQRAAPEAWSRVVERLETAINATDVIGWYEPGAVIGIVRSLARVPDASRPDRGDGVLDDALGESLEDEVARGGSFRVLVHPQPVRVAGDDLGTVARPFYPELMFRTSGARARDAAKRAVDIVGSLVGLMLLAPVLAVIAVLIRLTSSGPALFRQPRVGHLMKPFTVRKFRTMYTHADSAVHREFVSRFIAAGASNGSNGGPHKGTLFKLTNDPRITPLGRFLRKTSLDEVPQLWNVLRGDMSLVGPRPPLPYEYAQYLPWHRSRVLEAKPGLTGLWQIKGRSRTTFDDMVRLDLRYARTRSLWRDLAIICRTPAAVISGKGAC
jgi:lipopolysaccharide/colanic/teichoic acid biosynthesis glycosyltransferase